MATPDIDQRQLLAALAEELDIARAQIEALAAELCADIDVLGRHIDGLQLLDHAGQRCATIADILRSADVRASGRRAPLESIAQRFEARA